MQLGMFLRLHTIHHAIANTRATTRGHETSWTYVRESRLKVFDYKKTSAREYEVRCPTCSSKRSTFSELFDHMSRCHTCRTCEKSLLEDLFMPYPCCNLLPPESCDRCRYQKLIECENNDHRKARLGYEVIESDKRYKTN